MQRFCDGFTAFWKWGAKMFKEYPDILTPEQAAEALCISKNSVYRLIREQALGCKKVGRKILIPKICLQAYVRSSLYMVKM